MKFGKEKKETVWRFEVDMSDTERTNLKNYGLKQIKKDDDALINYAVNKILKDMVDKKK